MVTNLRSTFRPNGDRVLVERAIGQETTVSGIIIPDNAKEKAQTGHIIAVGAGKIDNHGNRIAPSVKVGDIVYFGKYAGTELDEQFLILKEDEILGLIQK